MQGSLFTKLAGRVASLQGEVYPLHVGDSWLEPPPGAHMGDLVTADHVGLHRYARPHGESALLEALSERLGVAPARLLITTGATGALDALANTLLDPGDEVLVCAPYWPLIPGIVTASRGVPVEVDVMLDARGSAFEAQLEAAVTPRTVAVYVNSPHNPTGRVLTTEELEGLVAVARRHDLWIWSDEVYEHHAWRGEAVPVRGLAPERTFSVHSFSKAWAMAGNRCGFLVGPGDPAHLTRVRRTSTHTFYSAPTASQRAALAALQGGDRWMDESREHYRAAGEAAADRLGVPRPEGGTFLFLDVADQLGPGGLEAFMHRCLDENLVLAPGTSCGAAYSTFVRLCFTSAPPETVARGVEILARLLGRGTREA
jgi:aspartate/methionine/tyrosine aminotransferase